MLIQWLFWQWLNIQITAHIELAALLKNTQFHRDWNDTVSCEKLNVQHNFQIILPATLKMKLQANNNTGKNGKWYQ